MPSQAFNTHLESLLADAAELDDAHRQLRTGARGRQWRLGAINRAVVVMSVSAWEAYVEEVLKENLQALRPNPVAGWAALNASALSEIGRFNNPNVENTRKLFASFLGLEDITQRWYWQNCDSARAREYLRVAMQKRHQIAHGVNPRPIIHNGYSRWLPSFFRNVARCTDRGIAGHLVDTLGMAAPPW